jgi:hypothetical protein
MNYFVIEDKERNGNWTLMNYPDGNWSIHGKGEQYCDEDETLLSEDDILTFIWKNRSSINHIIKQRSTI